MKKIVLVILFFLNLGVVAFSATPVFADCVIFSPNTGCVGSAKYYCPGGAGQQYCCTESVVECSACSLQDVGKKFCVIDEEHLCTLSLDGKTATLKPQRPCQYGCTPGLGCVSNSDPDPTTPPVPDKDLVTGKFLYEIDPLNPVNSGNSTNILDGLSQFVRFVLFQSPGGILSLLLPLLFTIAGLIVFVMVVWGGFEMLMSATSSKAQEAGKQRITAAIIGFALLFISYWLAQIIQMIFGVRILG